MQNARIVPQSLNLTARASFRVLSAKDTHVRCGPHGTKRTINYTVSIDSRPDMLDAQGFVIDWRDIFLAVAKTYRYVDVFPSCEQFAAEICDIVAKLLGGRCTGITVNVSIDGLPANMTAKWTSESREEPEQ